jgi:hypothetical protein
LKRDIAVVNTKEIDLQEMGTLRDASQRISQILTRRLSGYLSTLRPLFAPHKVLGEYMESAFSQSVPGADKNFTEIEEQYKLIARETFNISSKLGTPLPNIKNEIGIRPWEYLHSLDNDPNQVVRISTPVRWVLSYSGGHTLNDQLIDRTRRESLDVADLKKHLLSSLTLCKLIEHAPDIVQLLSDLRFNVSIEKTSLSGELPYLILTSDVPSFRPQDDLIRTTIKLSGKQVFEELIDIDAIRDMVDPLVFALTENV